MDNASLMVVAMAEECRDTILKWNKPELDLPEPLQPKHLKWMCDIIDKNAEDWSATKLHRWIGFIQCAMLANGMLDLDGLKAMFNKAKVAHAEPGEDLIDHLDLKSSFEVDVGGEG